MMWFDVLKTLHLGCALLSIAGFALRGYWALRVDPRLSSRVARTLPHLVDTLLLGSAIGMLLIWQISPLDIPWVTAKILALCLYIGLGMMVMRFAKTGLGRLIAYLAALLTAAYIVTVAVTRSPWGPWS